ncbi:hypothetical protein PR048_001677 [Dryococelus australis]|uniref:Integrase catalytic domain-containing protein n=1 Tax=Dryococelus australis TaxID=614101 RepID=A0ABQ9IKH7_9NEOP|nr:hypothetical protein PR048_001677 [Dryococelus australis]
MLLIITDTPQVVVEKCAMDIVGPMSEIESGNRYMLTCQDALSEKPIPSQDAETVTKTFVEEIVLKYRTPQSIVTDQGSNFMSKMMKHICKLLHAKKLNTSCYHHQSNFVERSHRTLVKFLRHNMKHDQDNWDKWVLYAEFVFNTTPQSSTGFAPQTVIRPKTKFTGNPAANTYY